MKKFIKEAFCLLTLPSLVFAAFAGGKKDSAEQPPQDEQAAAQEQEMPQEPYTVPDPENLPKPHAGEGGGRGAVLFVESLDPPQGGLTPVTSVEEE